MFYEIKSNDKPALIAADGFSLTYSELAASISEVSGLLEAGNLAFCLCENSPASVVGYLSCLNARVVPLLLDKRIERSLLQYLLDIYKPDYLYVPADSDVKPSEYSEIFCYRDRYSVLSRIEKTGEKLNPELALLLTTSGSTGSPKLVRQSRTNIQANAESIAQYLELSETERPITTLPMSYTYGLSIINSHLLVGATILMTDAPMTMKGFWTFMKEQKATSFGGVPFTYEMLKKVHFFKMDLPELRYMTQAGGKLDPDLHREFAEWCRDKGKKFIVMYGQTEATARMAYLPAEKSIEKYGSMGIPIPGGKFSLIAADGSLVTEPEVVGELVYEGPNVTLGYAEKRSDLALEDERHGRLETGDMAKIDKDGFYFIVGRKKRFLKIFGNRVNLDEIDRLVKHNFPDIDSASTGVDDHMKVYVTDASYCEKIKLWLSDTTHLNQSAFEVLYIEQIPKNEAGKVLYKNLAV